MVYNNRHFHVNCKCQNILQILGSRYITNSWVAALNQCENTTNQNCIFVMPNLPTSSRCVRRLMCRRRFSSIRLRYTMESDVQWLALQGGGRYGREFEAVND